MTGLGIRLGLDLIVNCWVGCLGKEVLSLTGNVWCCEPFPSGTVPKPGRKNHLTPSFCASRFCALLSWKSMSGGARIGMGWKSHLNMRIFFSLDLVIRVEKKERARLKTVKFHARTGMIESNRVSASQGEGHSVEKPCREGRRG